VRNPKTVTGVIVVLAIIVLGFVFIKAPQPDIALKGDELFTVGPLTVTNTLLSAYCTTLILSLLAFFGTRKADIVPRGFYNFLEAMVEWMLNFCEDIAGKANGRRFFPVIATIFLLVVSCNYFGLLPINNTFGNFHHLTGADHEGKAGAVATKVGPVYMVLPGAKAVKDTDPAPTLNSDQAIVQQRAFFRSPNSDANSPLSLAIWSAIFVEFWGLSTLGFKYIGKFAAFPPFTKGFSPMNVFVGALELLSEFIRIISFTFRLFGNIFAGDVVILFISFLVPFIIPTVFYSLETFFGFIQAAIFALLTLVFAVSAVEHHGEEEHDHGPAHESPGTQGELPAF
jgi:F-type H+-transporting ATPase subunit a